MTSRTSAFPDRARPYQQRLERHLDALFSLRRQTAAIDAGARQLEEAMAYSSLGGGKRIRAMLVYFAAEACRGHTRASNDEDQWLDIAAAAVELVHAYSLVHDDLPAMDDDELRRGKPSCHIAHGEAMAILAGDSLQTLAFEIITAQHEKTPDATLAIDLVGELATASGSQGMAGGQALDISSAAGKLKLPQLRRLHQLKTGALIVAATRMGARCAGAPVASREALTTYAECIGLAFQVQDDILDIEGTSSSLGKSAGKDIEASKATYPALLGLEGARQQARLLVDNALGAIAPLGESGAALAGLAHFIIDRGR